MPYAITNKNADCSGWAVVDPDNKVFGCHTTKASAIKQAVAISLATDEPFVGERKADGPKVTLLDIDGTLINGGRLVQRVYDFARSQEGALFIVTGRPVSERESTIRELDNLGVAYSRLIMNPGSTSDSIDYKKATAEGLLETYDVVMAIDNNSDARTAYRSLGIEVINPSDIPAEQRAINQEPPAYMRAAARKGLEYYRAGYGGDGLVERTIAEARDMANGKVSDDKWIRIAAWIARHLSDLDSPNANPDSENYPSAGVVAHLLWGSGPSKARAERALNYAEGVVARIRAEQESKRMTDNRALPDELVVGDTVAWVVETEAYAGIVADLAGDNAHVAIWDEEDGIWSPEGITAIVPIAELKKISPLVSEPEQPDTQAPESPDMIPLNGSTIVPTRDRWIRAAWAIKAKLEGVSDEARSLGGKESRTQHIELRAVSEDGMTFEGYGAVFNSPSEPLPFIEYVKPGAFTRSLKSRNRMLLLWNHDTSEPLASTRNGSLKLSEDERGLKVQATLPNTTRGRDVAELVRTGVIDSMSFGFSVRKDSWSADGQTRTLEDVTLYEVSLVSQPAYEGTAGLTSVREARDINPDQLADALLKLEAGEELETDQATLINEVVGKLQKTEEVKEVDGDILALKKAKLNLLMKEVQIAN